MNDKYLSRMADSTRGSYVFVDINRATLWAFAPIKQGKTAAIVRTFLGALHKAFPVNIIKLLTDNGNEFSGRMIACQERQPTRNHKYEPLCRELGIEQRLTRPRTLKTNGVVKRFNGMT